MFDNIFLKFVLILLFYFFLIIRVSCTKVI